VSVGRNDPCPCGSGRKFKHCCLAKDAIGGPLTGIGDAKPLMAGTPQRLAALARDAQERWAACQYVEAIGPLLEIAHHRPKSPEAQYELGLTFAKCGRFSEAVARLRAALELRPASSRRSRNWRALSNRRRNPPRRRRSIASSPGSFPTRCRGFTIWRRRRCWRERPTRRKPR
jgi:hypothetical protein